MLRRASLPLAVLTLLAACGGNVAVDHTGGSGGASTSTTGAGGSTGAACGGKQGIACAADEYCAWDPAGSCGNADGTGVCLKRPEVCDPVCGVVAVCGCDGQQYCNPCEAAQHGTDINQNGAACFVSPPAPVILRAFQLPTDVQRYAIAQEEVAEGRCFFVVVAGLGGGPFPAIDAGPGWAVEQVGATPNPADCESAGALFPLPPSAISADAAKGFIKADDPTFPCFIDVDLAAGFPSGSPAWAAAGDSIQTTSLLVEGAGCGG